MKLYRSTSFLLVSMFSLMGSIFVTGCSKDDDFAYNVPADFQPYIDVFISEASARGYSIVIDNLIINYDPTIELPHCARCNSTKMNVQKVISLNSNLDCSFSDEQQEALIFHELGHCILGRLHDDTLLPNGDFKSLMNTNDLGVYSSCVYPVDNGPCDNRFKRPYYLDELFDEQTPVPDWGN